jgi:hypothetical protein
MVQTPKKIWSTAIPTMTPSNPNRAQGTNKNPIFARFELDRKAIRIPIGTNVATAVKRKKRHTLEESCVVDPHSQ